MRHAFIHSTALLSARVDKRDWLQYTDRTFAADWRIMSVTARTDKPPPMTRPSKHFSAEHSAMRRREQAYCYCNDAKPLMQTISADPKHGWGEKWLWAPIAYWLTFAVAQAGRNDSSNAPSI